jgi:hypothetical protein
MGSFFWKEIFSEFVFLLRKILKIIFIAQIQAALCRSFYLSFLKL